MFYSSSLIYSYSCRNVWNAITLIGTCFWRNLVATRSSGTSRLQNDASSALMSNEQKGCFKALCSMNGRPHAALPHFDNQGRRSAGLLPCGSPHGMPLLQSWKFRLFLLISRLVIWINVSLERSVVLCFSRLACWAYSGYHDQITPSCNASSSRHSQYYFQRDVSRSNLFIVRAKSLVNPVYIQRKGSCEFRSWPISIWRQR